jgi:hypothetical protein
LQPFHSADQIGFGRFQQQMVVVAHEHPSVNPPAGSSTCFNQSRHPHFPITIILAIHVIKENHIPEVSQAHDMVNGTRILQSQFPCHATNLRQLQLMSILRTDPFKSLLLCLAPARSYRLRNFPNTSLRVC